MSTDEHAINWLTLARTPGIGPAALRQLLERFGSIGAILAASRRQLETGGLRPRTARAIAAREAATEAEAEWLAASRAGLTLLSWDDPHYPARLAAIHDPPLLLYLKGDPTLLALPGLAMVGARAASSYGRQVAFRLAGQLAGRGLTVISGLALGVDTAAHQGALEAGGTTIAVLGCGLDIVYPPENRKLFEKIEETGTLVSEYPLGTKPDGYRFPARNRIISGLALGVVVVEAARRSGSLITAQLALEQNREVFAIPGRVDSFKSEGSHRLLKDGAKLVQGPEDVLEELPPLETAGPPAAEAIDTGSERPALAADEAAVLALLDAYPQTIDAVIQGTGLPAAKVSETLLMLELKGLAEGLPGQRYRKK